MIRRPPRSTRTDTLFPYTTLFRSGRIAQIARLQELRRGSRKMFHLKFNGAAALALGFMLTGCVSFGAKPPEQLLSLSAAQRVAPGADRKSTRLNSSH